jgi:hypothetical protein
MEVELNKTVIHTNVDGDRGRFAEEGTAKEAGVLPDELVVHKLDFWPPCQM